MPYKNNDYKVYKSESGSKKIIFIEQTTVLLVVAFAIFKASSYFGPLSYSLPELVSLLSTWHPVVAGSLLSFLTWHVMYFDSAVPGVDPPTPLSPSKIRAMSGADIHLNYWFALLIGPLVTVMLYVA